MQEIRSEDFPNSQTVLTVIPTSTKLWNWSHNAVFMTRSPESISQTLSNPGICCFHGQQLYLRKLVRFASKSFVQTWQLAFYDCYYALRIHEGGLWHVQGAVVSHIYDDLLEDYLE
jgi:hypothetical protein